MARGENALIAVAGAPTAVTNGTIAGILDEIGHDSGIVEVYGAIAGLGALLEGHTVDLGAQKRRSIENLRRTPGCVLSGRHRSFSADDAPALVAALERLQVGTLFLLGGLAAVELARFAVEAAASSGFELSVLCVPLSPENEVDAGDHCPGYGSAARFAAMATRDAARGAQGGEEPVVVLEFGGAGGGWLAAASVLARDEAERTPEAGFGVERREKAPERYLAPHSILLPERAVDADELIEEARRAYQRFGYVVIVTTDAARSSADQPLDAASLTELLSDRLNLPARYDRLGLSASTSGASIARGDADEAYALGGLAVRLADDGLSGYAVAFNREGDARGDRGYKAVEASLRLDQIAPLPRALPAHFLSANGTGVSDEFIEWARPLLGGALPEYAAITRD